MQVPSLPPGPSYSSIFNNGGFPAPRSFVSVAQTPEAQTNPFAGYPVLARRWTNGMQQHLSVGDLVFIKAQGTGQSKTSSRSPVCVANVQQLNAMFASGADTTSRVGNAEQWRFFGVLNNDATRGGGDKLFNAIVRGRTERVTNVWPNARVGDKVGFALGVIDKTDGSFRYDCSGADNARWTTDLEHYMPYDFKLKYMTQGVEQDVFNKIRDDVYNTILPDLRGARDIPTWLEQATDEPERKRRERELCRLWTQAIEQNNLAPVKHTRLWLPFNFSQHANNSKFGGAFSHIIPKDVAYVGVISDMFSKAPTREQAARLVTQMPGAGDSEPGMSAWDPQCELLVRVG